MPAKKSQPKAETCASPGWLLANRASDRNYSLHETGCTLGYTGTGGFGRPSVDAEVRDWLGYLVTAIPPSISWGTCSFCRDEAGVMHFDTTGALTASEAACEARSDW